MIDLHDRDTGTLIASISEEELAVLVDTLEEESGDDQDYYIDVATLHLLADAGAPQPLLHILGQALGEREGMEVVWSRRG